MKFKEYFPLSITIFFLVSFLIILDLSGWSAFSFPVFVLVCLALAYVSFRKPEWVFWLFVALLPLEKVIITPEAFPISLRPYQVAGAILSIVLVGSWIIGKARIKFLSFQKICLVCKIMNRGRSCQGKSDNFNFLDRLVFVLPVFAFLGSIFSPQQSLAVKGALILVSFALLYWLARNFLQTSTQKLEALWFFSLGAIPVILFGIYQAIAFKFGWPNFQVFEARINGTFFEPDWFGMYLAFVFAVELWCLLLLNLSRNTTMIGNIRIVALGKIAAYVDIFLITALIALTVSRSAWLAAICVGLAYIASNFWFFEKKSEALKNSISVVGVVAFAGMFVVWTGLFTFHFGNRAASSFTGLQKITVSCESHDSNLPQLIENVGELEKFDCEHINLEEIQREREIGKFIAQTYRSDPNVDIRKEIYAKTWQAIREHPLTGVGVESSALVLGKDEHGSGYNASNIFLEIWISMGALALLIFTFLVFYLPVKLVKNMLDHPASKNAMRAGSFALLSFWAIVIPNLFNAGLLMGFLWVWLALLVSLTDQVKDEKLTKLEKFEKGKG